MLHVPTRSYPDCPKNKTEAPDRLLYQLTSFFFPMGTLDTYWAIMGFH